MSEALVLFEIRDGVGLLTLNNPAKRNALSRAMLDALRERLSAIATNQAVRVLIIAANGPVFSSGHDLRELAGCSEADSASLFTLCSEVMESLRKLPQPVIAQVQGLATAAGCQLVASCDLVVAAEETSFATPGVKIGLFCTTPAVALVRAVPTKKALEMLFTGETTSAIEGERIGLVNRVVPATRLSEETMTLARHIAGFSPGVLALGKRAFYEQLPLDRPQAYRLAQRVISENAQMPDAQEGIRAFLEKRPPRWPG
jgi:enoyl-CoA hydratase/carnithine racemase